LQTVPKQRENSYNLSKENKLYCIKEHCLFLFFKCHEIEMPHTPPPPRALGMVEKCFDGAVFLKFRHMVQRVIEN
jgi:hypothetical protein